MIGGYDTDMYNLHMYMYIVRSHHFHLFQHGGGSGGHHFNPAAVSMAVDPAHGSGLQQLEGEDEPVGAVRPPRSRFDLLLEVPPPLLLLQLLLLQLLLLQLLLLLLLLQPR